MSSYNEGIICSNPASCRLNEAENILIRGEERGVGVLERSKTVMWLGV